MLFRRIKIPRPIALLLLAVWTATIETPAQTSNVVVRVMAANLTSGSQQSYELPGIRIFQGLKPDIVAIQEFQYAGSTASNDLRTLVTAAFGANYNFYCEPNNGIPNGIISRYPIQNAGFWDDSDPGITDRGFAWARIDLPGTNDLYVVSVHLKASSGGDNESRRAAEAAELKDLITTNFPAGAWIIVAGDMNLYSESEGAITTFKTFLSDTPVPADQNGDTDTNSGRSERYDRLLPSFSLTNRLVPVVLPSHNFASGLVFDSRTYSPLSDVAPVLTGDSGVSGMQHMGVVKDFQISFILTNGAVAPVITNHPQSLTVTQNNNATFTVLAGGSAPLSYQWRFAGTNIGSATASSYTRSGVQTNHAGNYTVVITNSAGSLTSSPALLTVLVPPGIATQPQSLTVTQHDNATFTVTAAGTVTLGYQWRFGATNIVGATMSSYTRSDVRTNDIGHYTVVVTNAAGSVTSEVATLTVLIPPGIDSAPLNQNVSQGGVATFSVIASGSLPLGYQWRFNLASLAGATGSAYTRTNSQPADAGSYSVVVTNAAGGVTSPPASLLLEIPQPFLAMPSPDVLQWQGLSNLPYTVETRTGVDATNWTVLGTAASPSNTISFTNPPAGEVMRLFRVVYP